MANSKNVVYFSMGGEFSSLPIKQGEQIVFRAEVTTLQQDRLQDLLATYTESLNSGNYQLDTFDALVNHIRRIKAKPVYPRVNKELLDKLIDVRKGKDHNAGNV